MRAFLGLAALVMVTACSQAPRDASADGAWVRLPAVEGRPGAAYFTLRGGTTPATLVAVSSKAALRAELHESMKGEGGMMRMDALPQIDLPANAKVEFAPGGKHVMLFDMAPTLKAGERVPLTLSFADGKSLKVEAITVGAGDPAPK